MVPVQIRDVDNPERFLIDYIELPYEPRAGIPIYVFDDFSTGPRGWLFGNHMNKKARCIELTQLWRYEVSLKEPGKSALVFLGREVKP